MSVNKIEESAGLLSHLIGEQLSAVVFVMDYLQLQFNGAILTVLNPISVKVNNKKYQLGDLAFRDSLCERISHIVKNVLLSEDRLKIDFNDSSVFIISLKADDYSNAEAINFNWFEDGEERFLVL
ncbi:hypothetical protein BH10ACI1_BH10ACI1_06890 [soil metagenome]